MGAMTQIDPSARIADGVKLGRNVLVGPYCVIGPDVAVGDDVRLIAHVHLTGHTSIGARTVIYPFASLGTPPQSVKYRGGPTRLVVGSDCDIREHVTMNTGTEEGGGLTEVGDKCFLMVNTHVGHDCRVGNRVIMANNAVLGGHVDVGDDVVLGGQAAVHQFVRIGEGAMIAGVTGISADLIPFGFAIGQRGMLDGLNVVGLRRRGLARADIHDLRKAYQALFRADGRFEDRVNTVAAEFPNNPLVGKIVTFIRAGESRPLMHPTRTRATPAASATGG
jgi:UDP-N-acetylglucosamine acyltransferase